MIQHTNSLLIGQAPAEEQHILGDLLWPLDTEWVQTELNFSLNVHDILSDWFLLRAPWKYQNDRTASFYCSSSSSSSSSSSFFSFPGSSSSSSSISSSGLLCVGFLWLQVCVAAHVCSVCSFEAELGSFHCSPRWSPDWMIVLKNEAYGGKLHGVQNTRRWLSGYSVKPPCTRQSNDRRHTAVDHTHSHLNLTHTTQSLTQTWPPKKMFIIFEVVFACIMCACVMPYIEAFHCGSWCERWVFCFSCSPEQWAAPNSTAAENSTWQRHVKDSQDTTELHWIEFNLYYTLPLNSLATLNLFCVSYDLIKAFDCLNA